MQKQFTYIIIIAILFTIVIPATAPTGSEAETIQQKILLNNKFSSYLHIQYDATPLNSELSIDQTISIPITIIYQTNIPSHFLRFFPWQIRNYILFGSVIVPMQEIHLEILNKPSWANIQIVTEDILIDIPFDGTQATAQTTLLIAPFSNAPAQPYTFQLKASCESVGLLSGCESTISITFTTGWIPGIKISVENPIITAPAGSLVNAKINITNTGNSDSLLIGTIHSGDFMDGWGLCLEPSYLLIRQEETKHVTLRIGIPPNCTNCMRSSQLDFSAMRPYNGNITAGPYSLYMKVHGVKP
jgi:hypothetical protein